VVATAEDSGYYGGEAPMPWRDGFLSIRQQYVPSDVTLPELIPDLADRFPADVAAALEDAGVDLDQPGAIDEAIEVLSEVGLYEQVVEIVLSDPELSAAYDEVAVGGTYEQVAEYSPDGIAWEPVDFNLDLGDDAWADFRSNGEQLVATVTNNTWSDEGRRIDFSISVYSTDDLVTWTSVELPLVLPSAPDYVQVDAYTEQVAVGPDGWYVGVSVQQYVDLWRLLPERVQNGPYSWTPAPEGIRIEDWESVWEAEELAYESGDDESIESIEALEPEVVEIISWDDLPLSFDEWNDANDDHVGDRQVFIGGFDGSVAEANAPEGLDWFQLSHTGEGYLAWGQLHTPSTLTMQELVPDIEDRFPAEILDAFAESGLEIGDAASIDAAIELLEQVGLIDLATETVLADPVLLDAFDQVSTGTYDNLAFFSSDAMTWTPVTLPDVQWVDSIVPVQGGVLLLGSSDEGGQELWLGDPRGESWESIEGPDLGEHQWLYFDPRAASGDGLATVLDSGEPHGPEFLAWSSSVEHDGYELTMSADGEGSQRLVIVDIASGEVVRDTTIEMWAEELFIWGNDSFDFVDADGELIVSLPAPLGEELAWQAESEAWEEWYEANPYQPDLTLVATIDGRDWIVQKLDVDADTEGWYGGGTAAINNGVAVYRDAGGWHTVVVG
jgi:hypothetical protein